MASVPPENPPPVPDVIERMLEPFHLDPIRERAPAISPIDPRNVVPIPEADPALPAPPDDAPTQEDIEREREKLMDATDVLEVADNRDETPDRDETNGEQTDHETGDDHEGGSDHDGGEHDGGGDHESGGDK